MANCHIFYVFGVKLKKDVYHNIFFDEITVNEAKEVRTTVK